MQVSYLRSPIFIWWDVTFACNLKCKQCYSASGKPHPHELTTEEGKALIHELGMMKVFYIYFLGGEPLLRKDIFELASCARDHGIATMMSTNGWFVTPEIAKRLEECGLMHVRVSIDGATAATHDAIRGVSGSFKKAVNAVKILRQTGIPRIGITPTVLAENADEMEAIIHLGLDLKVDEMQLVQLCATGRANNSLAASIDQLMRLRQLFEDHRAVLAGRMNLSATEGISQNYTPVGEDGDAVSTFWGCPAGRTCAAVEAEGTVQPCILYGKSAGNVREGGFAKIWHSSPLFITMRTVFPECEGCRYARVCSRECPIDSCIDNHYRREFAKCSKKEVRVNG
jgi:radical SAM protein with 4Fe4S-binding SPASM domain